MEVLDEPATAADAVCTIWKLLLLRRAGGELYGFARCAGRWTPRRSLPAVPPRTWDASAGRAAVAVRTGGNKWRDPRLFCLSERCPCPGARVGMHACVCAGAGAGGLARQPVSDDAAACSRDPIGGRLASSGVGWGAGTAPYRDAMPGASSTVPAG